jgi:hypothetical protein
MDVVCWRRENWIRYDAAGFLLVSKEVRVGMPGAEKVCMLNYGMDML